MRIRRADGEVGKLTWSCPRCGTKMKKMTELDRKLSPDKSARGELVRCPNCHKGMAITLLLEQI